MVSLSLSLSVSLSDLNINQTREEEMRDGEMEGVDGVREAHLLQDKRECQKF